MQAATTITDGAVAGPHGPVPVRRYGTADPSAPLLLWVHGGAFVTGGLDQAESYETSLALAARGVRVTAVDYRLARSPASRLLHGTRGPDVRYPVPVDDVHAVARHERAAASGAFLLGGASAGACLAAATALRLAEAAEHADGAVLVYGILHAALPAIGLEHRRRLRGIRRWTHTAASVAVMNRHYAGSTAALLERDAFPGGHPLDGFPPALLLDADHDALRASGTRFAEELREQGLAVEHEVVVGARHAFLDDPRSASFGPTADRIAAWALGRG